MKRVFSVGDLCISCEIDVYGSAYSILRNETKRNETKRKEIYGVGIKNA